MMSLHLTELPHTTCYCIIWSWHIMTVILGQFRFTISHSIKLATTESPFMQSFRFSKSAKLANMLLQNMQRNTFNTGIKYYFCTTIFYMPTSSADDCVQRKEKQMDSFREDESSPLHKHKWLILTWCSACCCLTPGRLPETGLAAMSSFSLLFRYSISCLQVVMSSDHWSMLDSSLHLQ